GSRVGKITVPFALGGTIADPKVRPGKGVPTMTSGTTPSTTPPTQAPTPQQAVDTLKNLFNKKK
ncbi:MAG TPA: hypothetical protein VHS29_10435, partial [Candidatus Acidoferrales bacterium]|nr:hypothetical protein [Candidatus Acidoferrales bacterium]